VIESQPIGATVSIGATASYDATMAIESLIAKADAALYRAKHNGRNRVVATESEMLRNAPDSLPRRDARVPFGMAAFARISQRNKPARSA
jgi:hypothetical protein